MKYENHLELSSWAFSKLVFMTKIVDKATHSHNPTHPYAQQFIKSSRTEYIIYKVTTVIILSPYLDKMKYYLIIGMN
ncbi:hypothetical protein Bcop_0709 [Bacteroides coprosuis DSM 18011]|uniref:Uncharacterized protein n=2 Tax=Bacteroides coprosuis TaxID=151276 RepID=F3ZSQ2_9BACE|nr:hypothetical protein [Bacteroides coprosuis]EGJ70926.1 hypothetical protein Bcop_0709 [Bacteroides coprosuis DSM 18011]